ncbi:inactive dipeptidyl peptidase 10-like isoform X2 [Macrosteles quadrilineatus]|uniref:inactive dipeptidyl peptidase 10-like isoform X2 n=1 Tax=Macrosteles quadrilineatus TaxID=74068 RepID=UPI0023E0EC88|nr:inactive dipeptidyl peptidase 10-like isoform X2 [Macrosteles quadrilineatus]
MNTVQSSGGNSHLNKKDPGFEELVSSTPNVRNWRGMLIALLVIVFVLGLILFSIVLLSPPDEGPRVQGTKFTLEHITSNFFKIPQFNGSWVSDTEVVFRDVHGGLSVFNAHNNTVRVLMTNSTFRQLNAVDFRVSSDLKFVLLISDVKKIYTNTFEARYHIYEVSTQNRVPVTPGPTSVDDNEAPYLQLVVWAPRGSALAFVHQNDLYYKPKAKGQVFRLTTSGSPSVTNGLPDWVYQEEILTSGRAVWFAPDGKSLVYATFNDSLVGQLKYPFYGPKNLYPKIHSIYYPKPGTTIPEVTVWMVNVTHPKTPNTTQLPPTPVMVADAQLPYLIDVSWAGDKHVAVVWMNRRQNVSAIVVCSSPSWTCQDTHVQKSSRWVEPSSVVFSPDHSSYLTLLPVLDADAGHFTHICLIDRESHQVVPLTHGQLTVTRVLAWDTDNHIVYFEAAPEKKPAQRHVYRVSDIVNITTSIQWECLTCPTYPVNGSNITSVHENKTNDMYPVKSMSCLYTRATFSPGLSPRFYILECLGPDVPSVLVMNALTNTKVALLDGNSLLAQQYAAMARPQVRIFPVEMESGYQAQVKLLLPPGMREDEEMAFPLILKVGTTPGGQVVTERWNVDWSTYLVSQRNFIVAEIDGRGSGFQGDRMKHEIFRRVGQDDVLDQISVITYLRDNLRFIDRSRLGVWGKGYGGFATAMILSQEVGLFHCGISLAPITSWAHYDAVFTEKFMGTPNVTDNYRGYEESDLSKHAGNLKDKPFLLIHGSADNTVHFQHSMILVHAFTQGGIMFRHQTYPDEGHSFDGVRFHLYHAMEAFWDECFGPLDFIDWEIGSSFFSFKQ